MNAQLRTIIRKGLDQQIGFFRDAGAVLKRPAGGWLRAVRDATGLKQDQVAKKLGMSRQAYAEFEASEKKRAISLKSLEKAAEAMDCELIYFVVPRASIAPTFAELARIHDPLLKHLKKTEHSMMLEGQAVGDLKRPTNPKTHG